MPRSFKGQIPSPQHKLNRTHVLSEYQLERSTTELSWKTRDEQSHTNWGYVPQDLHHAGTNCDNRSVKTIYPHCAGTLKYLTLQM